MEDLKIILINLARFLSLAGIAFLLPLLVAIYYHEEIYKYLLAVALLFVIIGLLPEMLKRLGVTWGEMSKRHVMAVAALYIPVSAVITTIPFFFLGIPLIDAFFESMAGWTTLGLSFIPSDTLSGFPKSLIFFRSFLQWMGGLGLIFFALLIFKSPSTYDSYKSFIRHTDLEASPISVVKKIWVVYTILTLFGVFLLVLSGIDLLSSFNWSMISIATGGFAPPNQLPLEPVQELIITLMMIIGATSLFSFLWLLNKDIKKFFTQEELLTLLGITVIASFLFMLTEKLSLIDALFQAVSALTGTGLTFPGETLCDWSEFSKYVVISLMIIGGCYASTSGGLKIWRVILVTKEMFAEVYKTILPKGTVVIVKIDKEQVNERLIFECFVYVLMFMFIIFVSTAALILMGYSGINSLFITSSTMSSSGLFPVEEISAFPIEGKCLLLILMWVGRIEIFPVLVLAGIIFGIANKNRF